MASSSAVTVFLRDEKLRELAQLIRNHEVNNIYYITFQNPGEQMKYLRMCNENMASVNTILDQCKAVSVRYKGDGVRSPIADQILVYMEHCLNNALQLFRNYTMRSSYLDNIMDHQHQLFKALEELDQDAADGLNESILEFDRMVMAYMRLSLNPYASAEFSRYLRNIGISFSELVLSYQAKLGYTGRFEELEEEKKLEVYAAIIEASGRLSVLAKHEGDVVKASSITYNNGMKKHGGEEGGVVLKSTSKGKYAKYGSAVMLLKSVGQIVWDVYSADHQITTALRESLILAAKQGGSTLAKLLVEAAATEFLADVTVPEVIFTAVGLVTGYVGGFILAAAAGALFDLIVGSGGEKTFPTDGFVVYVAPMPDGHDLAKQIA